MKEVKGLIPNMVTPMDENGRPDVSSIHRLVNFLIEAGVGGIWVLGSAGEDIHIAKQDRVTVAAEAIKASDGRIPLIIGVGPATFYEILDFTEAISEQTFRGIHYLPSDSKMGESQLLKYLLKLADKLPCPLWLYHNPKRGRSITAKVVEEIKDHPNVHGIKVGGYSLTELTGMLMLRSQGFEVMGAGGGQLYQLLCLGAKAHTTSDGCCYPEPFLSILEAFHRGELEKAKRLQFKIIELSRKLPRTENGEYAAEEKYILAKRGLCKEFVNPAYRILTHKEKEKIDKALREFDFEWA
jgi:4-hydroxy-tetrahydrodipicolinate synthase